ncbi:MAG TPA: ABC transporter ATP-binding protein [Gaiellaceae bacterium]|nr:ABC transporter ATP-binding protein [Gaiellaceae bacterium]
MRPGEIRADRVSRRFRVHPEPVRTLKELVLRRGRAPASEVWALQDVSMTVEPGEAVGLVGRNGSGKTTLLSLVAGIITPTSGRVEAGGRVASLLELGAGFHPDFSGRENVYLNGSLYGLRRRTIDERLDEIVAFAELERFIDNPVRTYSSGMYMRLGFAVAAHIDADVLLLDEVFAVGDEEFQRKCFGKIFEYKQRGGTIVFVSHDAASVERLCERAVLLRNGRVELDGSAQEAIARYHTLLADERDPAEGAAGLREYGSGEARITAARLLGPEGEERLQLAAGEPVVVELRVEVREALPPPRVSLELRDEAGLLLAAVAQDTGELGWEEAPGERVLRFEVERPPLSDGRFRLRAELGDRTGRRLYHWLDDAARFVVYPGEGARGPVLLAGTWSLQEIGAPAEIGGR